ncbi:hypothetical protein ES705_28403 [subsurface metagenome]
MVMAIITSPENHKKLDGYREISRRLALAETLTDNEARALAAEGKSGTVYGPESSYQNWFSGGLRSTSTFHNMIGILSEIKGNPTLIDIPFLPSREE